MIKWKNKEMYCLECKHWAWRHKHKDDGGCQAPNCKCEQLVITASEYNQYNEQYYNHAQNNHSKV